MPSIQQSQSGASRDVTEALTRIQTAFLAHAAGHPNWLNEVRTEASAQGFDPGKISTGRFGMSPLDLVVVARRSGIDLPRALRDRTCQQAFERYCQSSVNGS